MVEIVAAFFIFFSHFPPITRNLCNKNKSILFVCRTRHSCKNDVECDEIRGECLEEIRTEVVTGDEFETQLNSRWKRGLRVSNDISIEPKPKKKTSVQLWIMLCLAMWHKTVATMWMIVAYCLYWCPFRLRHQPLRFLISFLNTFSAGDTLVSSH